MSAEPTHRSRARRFGAALAVAAVAGPLGSALAPAPAQAAMYGQLVVDEAARHYGAPYQWGATGPGTFDCSGFTSFVYRPFGIALPRTAAAQYDVLPHVSPADKQPGDLVFFYNSGGVYHVGIYAGGNTLWAATHTGDVVRGENMWTSQYLVARPVLGGAIGQHWQELGGAASVLGQAVDLEHAVPGGRGTDFQAGAVYWSWPTGAHEVHGAVGMLHRATGGAGGVLGLPTSDEYGLGATRAGRFVHGAVYWSPTTGVHEVHGAIARTYDALGGATGALGLPVSDERAAPGGRESAFQRGLLRWDAATGRVIRVS